MQGLQVVQHKVILQEQAVQAVQAVELLELQVQQILLQKRHTQGVVVAVVDQQQGLQVAQVAQVVLQAVAVAVAVLLKMVIIQEKAVIEQGEKFEFMLGNNFYFFTFILWEKRLWVNRRKIFCRQMLQLINLPKGISCKKNLFSVLKWQNASNFRMTNLSSRIKAQILWCICHVLDRVFVI